MRRQAWLPSPGRPATSGFTAGIVLGLEGGRGSPWRQGRLQRAARLWGAAEALREARAVPITARHPRRTCSGMVSDAAQADAATWAVAWEAGRREGAPPPPSLRRWRGR